MQKIIAVFVLVTMLGIPILAQTRQRPRVVQNPSPPTIKNETISKSEKRPPVLKGDASSDDIGEPPPIIIPQPIEDDDEIVKIETNLVTMPVTVLDRDGRFVGGLMQRDFRIFENEIEQQVGYFAKVETPFTVVLMLDVSPSTQYRINEIHDAAITFINQLRRDDRVMIIAFDEDVKVLARPTNDRNTLRNAIEQAQFGDGTSLYEAVDHVINRELTYIDGRKAVVLFTDGVDTTSRRSNYQTTLRDVEESEALFYPIRYDTFSGGSSGGTTQSRYPGPQKKSGGFGGILGDILGSIIIGGSSSGGGSGSAGSSRSEYETGKRYLEDLAANSGGRNFEAKTTSNLDSAFAGIAEELRQQYSIGYYPSVIGQNGDRKRIKVRVMRTNLVVRAKNSYIVGQNGG